LAAVFRQSLQRQPSEHNKSALKHLQLQAASSTQGSKKIEHVHPSPDNAAE
jgi:hypothetical protein